MLCVLQIALWMTVTWTDRNASAGEPPLADRYRAEDLRRWQDRLRQFDQTLPEPELLGFDRLIAYEESAAFAYAFGERSAERDASLPLRFRRVLLIKPGWLVVDDLWGQSGPDQKIGRVGWTTVPVIVPPDGDTTLAGLGQVTWSDANDPIGDLPEAGGDRAEPDTTTAASRGAVRTICLFQLGEAPELQEPISFEPHADRESWILTLPVKGRKFTIELARCYVEPGWIAAAAPDSGEPIQRRALPAGILPHGEQGVQLIERWDRPYRGQQRPGWDTGLVAEDLKRAVEEGKIKPCRVVELGCGSGTNAVYLAGLGFEVTAIDVAPTALGIAEAKASEAGVRVRWLLADVLNLPELGTFDLIFDRGCYHNVRYVDAAGFVRAMCRLTQTGSRALIVSLNRDGPPGVREPMMREDFSESFDFVWLHESEIQTGVDATVRRASWNLMLQRK
jgi:SAM-dependent methyltransferase